MHAKYSGRTALATIAGMAAFGWVGLAFAVDMVIRAVA